MRRGLLIGLLLICSVAGFAGTCGNSYTNSGTITIPAQSSNSADISNYILTITGTYGNLATTGNGGYMTSASGYDFIACDAASAGNQINTATGAYNATTGAVTKYVLVSTLHKSSSTTVYLFWGNSSVTTTQDAGSTICSTVGLKAWYPLQDNAATTTVTDLCGSHNGTAAANTSTKTTSGQFGSALTFNGSSDKVDLGSPSIMASSTYFTISLSAWAKTADSTGHTQQFIVAQTPTTCTSPYTYEGIAYASVTGTVVDDFELDVAGTRTQLADTSHPANGVWHYFSATYNAASVGGDGLLHLRMDGSRTGVSASSAVGNIVYGGPDDWFIGVQHSCGGYFDGSIQEVRLNNSQETADWSSTTYANQSAPSTFYTQSGLAAAGNRRRVLVIQ